MPALPTHPAYTTTAGAAAKGGCHISKEVLNLLDGTNRAQNPSFFLPAPVASKKCQGKKIKVQINIKIQK
jgi:hypothetical protein